MERKPVQSSNLKSVGWKDNVMEIEFHSGGIYSYKDVGQTIFEAFLGSPSKGKYFHQYIKSQFTCEKIEKQFPGKRLADFVMPDELRKEIIEESEKWINVYNTEDGKISNKCCREAIITWIKYFFN